MRNHFKRHGKASGPSCIRDVPPKRLVDETAGGGGGETLAVGGMSGWNELRISRDLYLIWFKFNTIFTCPEHSK